MRALFLLDVRVDPVSPVPWAGLIVLLLIVFVLAVSLIAGLVLVALVETQKDPRSAGAS